MAASAAEPGTNEALILADALAAYMPESIATLLRQMPRTRDGIGRFHCVKILPPPGCGLAGAVRYSIANELVAHGLLVRDRNTYRLSILGAIVCAALDDRPVKIAAAGAIVKVEAPADLSIWQRLLRRSV